MRWLGERRVVGVRQPAVITEVNNKERGKERFEQGSAGRVVEDERRKKEGEVEVDSG